MPIYTFWNNNTLQFDIVSNSLTNYYTKDSINIDLYLKTDTDNSFYKKSYIDSHFTTIDTSVQGIAGLLISDFYTQIQINDKIYPTNR